jgi:hypothetical protein
MRLASREPSDGKVYKKETGAVRDNEGECEAVSEN